MNVQTLSEIRRMAEEVSAREGCYLYDLEFVGGGEGRILRVYIDRDAGGPTLEDCSKVSRGLNTLLDEDDKIPDAAYNLEVSTPGLERTLKNAQHFERVIGKKISVKTFAPLAEVNPDFATQLGKAKMAEGQLVSFNETGLRIDQNGLEIFVPLANVTKAHVVFEFTDPSEKPAGKPPRKKEKAKK